MTAPATKKMDVLACDLLASRHIASKDLEKERDLTHSCWWEYRGSHPTTRTFQFAFDYSEASQRYHGKYRNAATADYAIGISGGGDNNIFRDVEIDQDHASKLFGKNLTAYESLVKRKRMTLMGLWRARQAADELGISYRIYIAACFERAAMAGWKFIPRPLQLYGDKMQVAALDEQAKELVRYIPDFTNKNLLVGSTAPFKRDFDKWLYELGLIRHINVNMTYNRMAQQGYITQDQADSWTELAREV